MQKFIFPSKYDSPEWIDPLLVVLKRWIRLWWLFAIVCLIAITVGYFYAVKTPVKYKSRLTFALEEGNSNNLSNLYNLASQFGISVGGESSFFAGDNIVPIIKSRKIVESVLLSIDSVAGRPIRLIDIYQKLGSKKGEKRPSVDFPAQLSRNQFSAQQDSVLFQIYQEFSRSLINVDRPDKRLSIYEINVTTSNEQLTHDFCKRLLDSTNDFYIELKTQKFKQTLDVLERRAEAMQGNLNQSIYERAATQDKNLNPAFAQADVPVLKQQSNIQVYGAAYAELFKNLEITRLHYLNSFPIIQKIDDVNYPMERVKKSKSKTMALFGAVGLLLVVIGLWAKDVMRWIMNDRKTV